MEDNPSDRELAVAVLAQDGLKCQFSFAETSAEFAAALMESQFDVILVDYALPSFTGTDALQIATLSKPELPLLFISGTIGPETAASCIKKGATDFIPKSHVQLLAPALRRALREASEGAARKQLEAALRESELRFQELLSKTPHIAVRWYDADGHVTFWNSAAEKVFGWKAEEAVGRRIHPPWRTKDRSGDFADLLRKLDESDQPMPASEYDYERRNRSRCVCLGSIVKMRDSSQRPSFVCLDIDITNQKQSEEALRLSMARLVKQEETLISLTRETPEADLLSSIRRITEASAKALETARVSFWQSPPNGKLMRCVDLYELFQDRHTSGIELSCADYPIYFQDIRNSEVLITDDDECVHPRMAEFSASYLCPLGITSAIDVPIRIKGALHGVLWLEHVGSRRQWAADERSFAMAIANHLTRLIEDWERKELEDRFRHAQKMEAVGQLAGGIAHDFNNMLAAIQIQSSLLLEEPGITDGTAQSAREILSAVERGSNLTRQLLTFSRRKAKEPRNLDIPGLISPLIKLMKRIVRENIALDTTFPSSRPMVHADPGMVEQIIMNLVINASDAMPNGGRISILLECLEIDEERAAPHPGVGAGPFVCLTVGDTGRGIPKENLSRIFEPFFTTKQVGRGAGLGLATVSNIVDQHRGWIEVQSEVGKGSRFQVFLPAVRNTEPLPAAQRSAEEIRGGKETILIVEDDQALRKSSRSVLERYGYTVFEAPTAAVALKRWNTYRAVIDLVFTDVVLPDGISGRTLIEQLQTSKPDVKVIFCSGYSSEIVAQELGLKPGRDVLQKPYSGSELAATVRRSLDDLVAMRTARFAAAAQVYKPQILRENPSVGW